MDKDLHVQAGMLLAAWPNLMDPNFMHSVILICQHSPEGAYGLVTNQLTEYTVSNLMPEHEVLGNLEFPVHLGGPVDHASMQFLHTVPDEIPGGMCLDGSIWLGGTLDAMGTYIARHPEEAALNLRVFLGYSGWGAGQLDQELGGGSWVPAPPSGEAVFGAPGEATWRKVIHSIGEPGRELGDLPPDVSWN